MNSKFLCVLVLCALSAGPVASISRWFSATYNDLKFTMYRYGYCVNGLLPLNSSRVNETDYLINQIRVFLDQGNYDNEQLANVTSLMDSICRLNGDHNYPISMHIDIHHFSNNNTRGKENRCRAIDDSMDSMYYVFKRAALNRSEPLDFSSIQYKVNETAAYNLSDLINTSWISSDTVLEHVCTITNATKEYVAARASKAAAQSRQQLPAGYASSLLAFIDRMVEPLLGLQKRLYWEGTTRLEIIQTRLSSGLDSIRRGVRGGIDSTRGAIFGSRSASASAPAGSPKLPLAGAGTGAGALNSTGSARANGTSPSMVSGRSSSTLSSPLMPLNATEPALGPTTTMSDASFALSGTSVANSPSTAAPTPARAS